MNEEKSYLQTVEDISATVSHGSKHIQNGSVCLYTRLFQTLNVFGQTASAQEYRSSITARIWWDYLHIKKKFLCDKPDLFADYITKRYFGSRNQYFDCKISYISRFSKIFLLHVFKYSTWFQNQILTPRTQLYVSQPSLWLLSCCQPKSKG